MSIVQYLNKPASLSTYISALALMSCLHAAGAMAQALPDGCTDNDNDIVEDNDTITCTAPPSEYESLLFDAEYLNVTLGDGTAPMTIGSTDANQAPVDFVLDDFDDDFTVTELTIQDEVSIVNDLSADLAAVNVTANNGGTFTIYQDGKINSIGDGIVATTPFRAVNTGLPFTPDRTSFRAVVAGDITTDGNGVDLNARGSFSIGASAWVTGTIVAGDTGVEASAIGFFFTSGAGVTVDGTVIGGERGVAVTSSGAASIWVSGEVRSPGIGLDLFGRGGSITIDGDGHVYGGDSAIVFDSSNFGFRTLTLADNGSIDGDVIFTSNNQRATFSDGNGNYTRVLGPTDSFGNTGSGSVIFTGQARTLVNSGQDGDRLQNFGFYYVDMDGLRFEGVHVVPSIFLRSGVTQLDGETRGVRFEIEENAGVRTFENAQINTVVRNRGTIHLGETYGVLPIFGDYEQFGTGVLNFDVSGLGQADKLEVASNAFLAGTLNVNLTDAQIGEHVYELIYVNGTTTGWFDQINLDNQSNSLLYGNSVFIDPNTSSVMLRTRFLSPSSIGGLSQNRSALGDAIFANTLVNGIESGDGEIYLAFAALNDAEAIGVALQDLSLDGSDMALHFALDGHDGFVDTLLSNSAARTPIHSSNDGALLFWGDIEGKYLNSDGDQSALGFEATRTSLFTGLDAELSPAWQVRAAGGYGRTTGFTEDALDGLARGDDGEAELWHVGLSAKRRFTGAVGGYAQLALSHTEGENQVQMQVNALDTQTQTPTQYTGSGDIQISEASARVALTDWQDTRLAVSPYLQLGYTVFEQDGFDIGTGALEALSLGELDSVRSYVGLGAEADTQFSERVHGRAKVTALRYFGDTEAHLRSRFQNSASSQFVTQYGQEVRSSVNVGAAVMYAHPSGWSLASEAEYELGDLYGFTMDLRLAKRF